MGKSAENRGEKFQRVPKSSKSLAQDVQEAIGRICQESGNVSIWCRENGIPRYVIADLERGKLRRCRRGTAGFKALVALGIVPDPRFDGMDTLTAAVAELANMGIHVIGMDATTAVPLITINSGQGQNLEKLKAVTAFDEAGFKCHVAPFMGCLVKWTEGSLSAHERKPAAPPARAGKLSIKCHYCQSACITRTSREVSAVSRELYMDCTNPDCEASFVVVLTKTRNIRPSKRQELRPEVELPTAVAARAGAR